MKDPYLPPRVIQGIGIALLIVMLTFWALTGRESQVFVGAACGMIMLGVTQDVKHFLSRAEPPPDESKSRPSRSLDQPK